MPAPLDIHPRLLRSFIAVAEELHFGRAATRMFVAQQALSRDVRKLEDLLGLALFDRDTRHVELTADGRRLLPKARRIVDLHQSLVEDVEVRPFLVDLNSPGLTGPDLTADRLLAEARRAQPDVDVLARFHGGLTAGAQALLDRRLDVSFGRFAGLAPEVRRRLWHQLIRLEPMAVIVPRDHPLAGLRQVPVAALGPYQVDICAGSPATVEWADLGYRFLTDHGLRPAPPHAPAVGPQEFARYLARHGDPVLTTLGADEVPGAATRPLVDPVPLSPVSLVSRPNLRHPTLAALLAAAAQLGSVEGWLQRPAGSWLPAEDLELDPKAG
ncbi:LysR family transcriptional regulator [Catenulispora subtropica]|uniref:LysR family transcriptional regulator StgR n=1 Tax=Catenulispora subtropica TaxID=450798 RepID=A0ABP5BR58_9ACTN